MPAHGQSSTGVPRIALALGVALVLLPTRRRRVGALHTSLPQRMGARIKPGGAGLLAYLGSGLPTGLASLSGTLPIFLAVVGTSVIVGTVWSPLGSLVVYGLGMGSVVLARPRRRRLQGRHRDSPAGAHSYVGRRTLLIAGACIVYYWLTVYWLTVGASSNASPDLARTGGHL